MSAAVIPPLRRYTRDDVQKMEDADLFEGRRYELIDGELIDKMGQNPPHASTIRNLTKLLARIFGLERILVQSPVDVSLGDRDRNLPEPDLALLAEDKPEFTRRHPRGDELLLAIEVADTSLRSDLTTKRDLYARAGVPEYWVVDLNARRVIAHRAPSRGVYADVTTVAEHESIALESHAAAAIPLNQILP
jgi:Uma2 family endonuclease